MPANPAPYVEDLLRQWADVSARRSAFQSVWQEIADHLLGRRDFSAGASPGRKRMARIYDTTGLQAADLLSAALHSFLTNPALRWFSLRAEDPELAAAADVRAWLGAVEDALYAAFNAPDANFAPQIHEVYLDQVAFGTAALYIGDRPGRGLLFSARPLGEIHVAENAEGRVDTVFRRFEFTARQAHQVWGMPPGRVLPPRWPPTRVSSDLPSCIACSRRPAKPMLRAGCRTSPLPRPM